MNKLTQLAAWQALQTHHRTIAEHSMQAWFATDAKRFERFSLTFNSILLDFSKNRINQDTLKLLLNLATEIKLKEKIAALFAGAALNFTEQRPALHTALRDRKQTELWVAGQNIMPDVQATLAKMQSFTAAVRAHTWRGITGKPVRDIINIGIGGSHLGPLMTTHALADYASPTLHCHFVSTLDGTNLQQVLQRIDPEAALFIISSKSFTTLETLTNAKTIYAWLQDRLGQRDVSKHFVAVTAAPSRAQAFGVPDEQIFPLWEWVGGRYSIWSAIGLPLALMVGMDNFYEFLRGAYEVDQHFQQAPFAENLPVILALLGIWYINFFACTSHAIAPYASELNYFRHYIQQADMESNGKTMTQQNMPVDYATGPVIFGEHGCDSQHSFFELLHQGSHLIPLDFILVAKNRHFPAYQDLLVGSGISQAQALLCGKTTAEAYDELHQAGYSETVAAQLALHKTQPGNRPSNTLFLPEISPYTLGSLLALYEHKIFVQGIIWDINSYDQWGVELGKQLLLARMADLKNQTPAASLDTSTTGLLQYYQSMRSNQ